MHFETKPSKAIPVEFAKLPVIRFMEPDVYCAEGDTWAQTLAVMIMEGLGAVPFVDRERRLRGIVSEYDLLVALERGWNWHEVTADDIMTSPAHSVPSNMQLEGLVRILVRSGLIRVPVVEADNRVIGAVSRRDVLRAYLNYLSKG